MQCTAVELHKVKCMDGGAGKGIHACSPIAKWQSMYTNSSSASSMQLMSLDIQNSSTCTPHRTDPTQHPASHSTCYQACRQFDKAQGPTH